MYSQEQLQSQLNPILTTLWNCDPDAEAFRAPVDTVTLGIPEYYSIVSYPMDLSTISQRLSSGQYQCPWQFIDDIWLMFNNAWLFNRRNTKVYKSCTKVCRTLCYKWLKVVCSLICFRMIHIICKQTKYLNPHCIECLLRRKGVNYTKFEPIFTNTWVFFFLTCKGNVKHHVILTRNLTLKDL